MKSRKQILTLAIAGILASSPLIHGSNAFAATAKAPTEQAASEAVTAASSDADNASLINTVEEAYKALREIRGARVAIFNGSPEEAVKLTNEAHSDLAVARDTM